MRNNNQLKLIILAFLLCAGINHGYACGGGDDDGPTAPSVTISASGGSGICSASNGYTIDIGNAESATISLFGGEILSFPSSCGNASITTGADINGEYIFLTSASTFTCTYAINATWPSSFALVRVTATNSAGSTSRDLSVSSGITVNKIAGDACSPPLSLSATGANGASYTWSVNSTSGDPLPTLSNTAGYSTHLSNIGPGVFTVTATAKCGSVVKDYGTYTFQTFSCLQRPNVLPQALSEVKSFDVFPNPAQTGDEITLRLPNVDVAHHLKLFDQRGAIVKQWRNSRNLSTISTESLPAGVYFLQLVTTKGKAETKKLVIK